MPRFPIFWKKVKSFIGFRKVAFEYKRRTWSFWLARSVHLFAPSHCCNSNHFPHLSHRILSLETSRDQCRKTFCCAPKIWRWWQRSFIAPFDETRASAGDKFFLDFKVGNEDWVCRYKYVSLRSKCQLSLTPILLKGPKPSKCHSSATFTLFVMLLAVVQQFYNIEPSMSNIFNWLFLTRRKQIQIWFAFTELALPRHRAVQVVQDFEQ